MIPPAGTGATTEYDNEDDLGESSNLEVRNPTGRACFVAMEPFVVFLPSPLSRRAGTTAGQGRLRRTEREIPGRLPICPGPDRSGGSVPIFIGIRVEKSGRGV